MATIASNPVFSGISTGAPTSAAGATAEENSGTFLKLVTGMIQGGTSGDQLPSNLAAFLLTGDSGLLEGIETDTAGDTSTDDDVSDEEAMAALSALLAGIQAPVQNVASGGAEGSDSTGVASVTTEGSQRGDLLGILGSAQDAVAAALEGAADGANGGADATAFALGADADGAGVNGVNGPQQTSASHLQSMIQAHRAADAAPQAASSEVRTPVGAQGWSDEIGTHLTMMAANGREAASLRLSPEHLGPLEIRISMKDGEATVMFNASNADTRSALEQSLPRLREMFASQGLVLGDANVSRDAPRDSFRPATFAKASRGSSDGAEEVGVKPVTLSRLGLVDTYV
jgi:flagellar hook-length control protein FliK